jgi:hypothetical protein
MGEDGAAFVLEHVAPTAAPGGLLELRIVQLLANVLTRDDREYDVRLITPVRLDENVDLAAARQADSERHLVGDPVRDQPGLPSGEHFLCREDDVVLDAAVRDRTFDAAVLADEELRSDRTRRRAPRGDDGGNRYLFVHATQSSWGLSPEVGLAQILVLAELGRCPREHNATG